MSHRDQLWALYYLFYIYINNLSGDIHHVYTDTYLFTVDIVDMITNKSPDILRDKIIVISSKIEQV